jgi:hypothetical protein
MAIQILRMCLVHMPRHRSEVPRQDTLPADLAEIPPQDDFALGFRPGRGDKVLELCLCFYVCICICMRTLKQDH